MFNPLNDNGFLGRALPEPPVGPFIPNTLEHLQNSHNRVTGFNNGMWGVCNVGESNPRQLFRQDPHGCMIEVNPFERNQMAQRHLEDRLSSRCNPLAPAAPPWAPFNPLAPRW